MPGVRDCDYACADYRDRHRKDIGSFDPGAQAYPFAHHDKQWLEGKHDE
ncbi:hypothetical protein GCM10025858_29420 [Alicyclobacillus sacchari]|nr:hypothetical protein GCM10025858_29420 [Alicyclobacillus sacchari]